MCLSACSVVASGRGGTRGSCASDSNRVRWSRSCSGSGSESRRSARRKALRFTADSNASIEGVNHAPRPGSVAVSSTTRRPSRATTLTSEDRGARARLPMHVLTGTTLPPRVAGAWIDIHARASRIGSVLEDRVRLDGSSPRPGRRRWRVVDPARGSTSRLSPRGSNRAGCRSAHPSASRRGGRSGPPCRWRARAGSRARGRGRPSSPGR